MDELKSIYSFWDLIAQEAYLPSTEEMQNNTISKFIENDSWKRVWLFACNEANKALIELYSEKLNIVGVLDNSEAMWGKDFCGVKVCSVKETIPSLSKEKDVVIISLRLNADIAYRQITDMGFFNVYSLGVMIGGIEPYHSFIGEINKLKRKELNSDIVLMESMNDFDGNTGALYTYLKEKGSKKQFVWLCNAEDSISDFLGCNDKEIIPNRSIEDLKEYIRLRATAKWEIWECDPIRKVRNDQINVFLQHYGMGYKQVAHLYNSPAYVDYVLTTNEFVHGLESKSITYAPTSKFIYGELPRNDVLFKCEWDELSKLTPKKFKKVIMWAPTLRASRYYHRVDSDILYPFGISLIYSKKDMELLNEFLKELDLLLIVKPHPRQRIDFSEDEYSNILYLDGDRVKRIHAYKLLVQMDALITDYSSMVFDYMLLDRPCAWVLEDREHYKIDYLMDNPEEYMPGDKIYKIDDLHNFLKNVSEGRDLYREERRKICARCNPPAAGKGCEHIAEVLGL